MKPLATAGLLLGMVFFATQTQSAPSHHPDKVPYHGWVRWTEGKAVDGQFPMVLRYFDRTGQKELLVEKRDLVRIKDGRFDIQLGEGRLSDGASPESYSKLSQVFADHAELQISVAIGEQSFNPRVRMLAPGHSLETRAVLAGLREPDDGKEHWKHYSKRADGSAVEAALLTPGEANAVQPSGNGPFLLEMNGPSVSPAMRDLPINLPALAAPKGKPINPMRHETLFDKDGNRFGTMAPKQEDVLASASSSYRSVRATPGLDVSFDGMVAAGHAPPDTEGAVGPNHYVQMVNVALEIFDKSGNSLVGPISTNNLWAGFGGPCETDNDGDAIALYDQLADRWVLAQFAVSSGAERVCFAVSTSGDPTGTYYRYELISQRFPDYFKLGVWPDATHNAYFMGTNSGHQNQYDVYAIDRVNMLAGNTARPAQYFQNFSNLLLPADHDGAALPPAGSPGLFYTFRDGGEPYFGSPPNDSLDLYEFSVNWNTPANSTFTQVQSFAPPALADFIWTVCGFFVGDCLDQPGTTQLIDSLSQWPMQRFVYRNFGSHEALVGTWTVDTNPAGNHAAPRWFELRDTGSGWGIYQQGTHSPDATHRWMGSIALDGGGNIALGYSASDTATYPSIRYATRLASDSLGTLQTEATLFSGSGSQIDGLNRWGDYSSMEIDPADDCTFWYTTEYLSATGSFNWRTRIGAFKLPECGGPGYSLTPAPQTLAVCAPNDAQYNVTATSINGFVDPVTLNASGNPSGTSVAFSVNPLTPTASSLMTISNTGAAAPGHYDIDINGLSSPSALAKSTSVGLDLFNVAPAGVVLTSPANGAVNVPTLPTLQWSAVAEAVDYFVQIASDSGFNTVLQSATVAGTSYTLASSLPSNTVIYWRVRASNACGAGGYSVTYSFTTENTICSNPNQAIPDESVIGVSDDLVVAGGGSLADLNVDVIASHTWVGDLVFTLTHVDTGTAVTLVDRPGVPAGAFGCSGNDIDAILDDEAASPVESQCAAGAPTISGTFSPNNPLSVFDGEDINGTWRLNASDYVGSDTGTLATWCLRPVSVPSAFTCDGSNVTVSNQTVPAGQTVICTVGDIHLSNVQVDGRLIINKTGAVYGNPVINVSAGGRLEVRQLP